MRVHKGDKVIIIAGKERNKTGVVEKVFPKTNRIVVAGLNMVKKHLKRSAAQPQGGIIEKEATMHISNVMVLDPSKNKPTRVGVRQEGSKKVRVAKLSGQIITAEKK